MLARTSLIVAALGVLVLLPTRAGAELEPALQRCQSQLGKQGQRFFNKVAKAVRRCQERISSGGLPAGTDCTVEDRAARRLASATSRFTDAVTRRCPDAVVAGLVFGGDCFGVQTAAELASCQRDVHLGGVLALRDVVYQTPPTLNPPRRKCESVAAREAAKATGRILRLVRRCKDRIARGRLPAGTDCGAANAISVGVNRAATAIADRCADSVVATLGFGPPCVGVTTGTGLAACLVGTQRSGAEKLIVAAYGSGLAGGPAVARQITDPADCVGGPLSRCRPGDYLLANDRIRVVVQDIQRNLFGIGQFGGQIVDADLVRAVGDDRDNFEEWSVAINIENTAHYTDLTILNDGADGQAAVIRVTGVDDLLDFLNPSSVLAGFGLPFPAGSDDTDLPVEVVTDYFLEPGRSWVRVSTTVQNVSAAPVKMFFGDFLNGSGQVDLFQSGYGFGEPLITTRCPVDTPHPCNYVAYAGFGDATGVSYGYVHDLRSSTFSTSGVTVPLLGTEVISALIGAVGPNFTLEAMGDPGDRLTFTRHLVVGDGTVGSIVTARNHIECRPTGRVEGTVTAGGAPVAGAEVVVLGSPTDGPALVPLPRNVLTHTVTDAMGGYAVEMLPGSYDVVANLEGSPYEGGGASPTAHPVTVTAFQTTVADVGLPTTGALQVTVVDETSSPIPAKVSVVGFDPSPDPGNTQSILGLVNNSTGIFNELFEDGVPFGVPQVHFLDQTGDSGVVPIEPGDYRIVVSHGPEHSIAVADVTIVAGATSTVNAQIARVVDTTGFIGADFHVHSIDSPDAAVSRSNRVVTMLAEGVDFFTPSDHDIRVDFQSTIDDLGVGALVATAPSGEITTFDYGHFNAWPMTIDPAQVNGGSVDHGGSAAAGADFPSLGSYSLAPAAIIAAAAADPGTNTVQVNHTHSHFGLDGGSGLAIDTGMTPPQSLVPAAARRLDPAIPNFFSDLFDALEIWIGDNRGQVFDLFLGQNIGDWFNLINQGIVRTGIADSDTHRRKITQSGTPRSMVASPTDDPASLGAIVDTLSANVNAGRLIGTNAPMVRVTTSAASTGETGGLELGLPTEISTTDGAVDVVVDIQSPIWAEFDRVEFYVNTTTTKSESTLESGAGPVVVPRYSVTPDAVQTAGVDFAVSTVVVDAGIPGAERLEASTTLNLSGLTADVWVVVVVKGTDGVSRPLFPMVPNSLDASANPTLADLIDGNLGEDGMTALAFTNPLFVDVDGGGWSPPGVQVSNP